MPAETVPHPSDDVAPIVATGRTDVRVGVLSLSARSPEGLDAQYLEWHLLDHLPEQYRLAGLRRGTRGVSTPGCRAARAASDARFDAVDHVVQYLFAEPSAPALDRFFALGAALREAGRMPLRLPSVELAAYGLVAATASPRALVGADVLPWRPMRGVYLLIERGADAPSDDAALGEVDGVAGSWRFRGAQYDERFAENSDLRLTVCYLDDEPATTAARLTDVLDRRWAAGDLTPLLAAPFELVTPWDWHRALP